jgi:transcription elongation factor Elf1
MSNATTIDVTCPRCGHTWVENLTDLARPTSVTYKGAVYRGEGPKTRVECYSVFCKNCGNYPVVEVTIEERPNG